MTLSRIERGNAEKKLTTYANDISTDGTLLAVRAAKRHDTFWDR